MRRHEARMIRLFTIGVATLATWAVALGAIGCREPETAQSDYATEDHTDDGLVIQNPNGGGG